MNVFKTIKLFIITLSLTFSCSALLLTGCSDTSLTKLENGSGKVNDSSKPLDNSNLADSLGNSLVADSSGNSNSSKASGNASILGSWTEKDTNVFMSSCRVKISNENRNFDANTVIFLCGCAFNLIQPVYLPKDPFVLNPNDELIIEKTCLAQAGIPSSSSSSGTSSSGTDKCSGLEYSDELLCRGVPANLIP